VHQRGRAGRRLRHHRQGARHRRRGCRVDSPPGNVLLRNREFRWLWLSRSVSSIGDGIALIALVLYVKAAEHSGVAVAALLLAQTLPHLLGPVTGTLVDRLNLKRLMVACELSQAIIFSAIALWQPPFFALLLMIVVASILDTTFGPASGSAVPAIVAGPDLMQANAWLGTSLNLQVAIELRDLGSIACRTSGDNARRRQIRRRHPLGRAERRPVCLEATGNPVIDAGHVLAGGVRGR
jgi:hypothetical protein